MYQEITKIAWNKEAYLNVFKTQNSRHSQFIIFFLPEYIREYIVDARMLRDDNTPLICYCKGDILEQAFEVILHYVVLSTFRTHFDF